MEQKSNKMAEAQIGLNDEVVIDFAAYERRVEA